MSATWNALRIVLTSLLFAGLIVICPLELWLPLLVVLSVCIWYFRMDWQSGLKHGALIGLFVAAAAFAPVKAMNEVLDQEISLPSRDLTMAELVRTTESWREPGPFRIWISWNIEPADETQSINFPAEKLALREFIVTVENQTELRHHFSHCGNSYTILWGLHPSTMMSFHRRYY